MNTARRLVALMLWLVASACFGQSLTLVNGLSLPFGSEYAVYRDTNQSATFVYSPLQMRMVVDGPTGKSRIGVQYFTDPTSKTLKLAFTTTLQFIFEKDKLNDILSAIRKQSGAQASLAVAVGGSVACRGFAIQSDENVVFSASSSSNVSFNANVAITSTLNLKSKNDLGPLLKKNGRLGIICGLVGPKVAETASTDVRISVENLLAIAKTTGWVGANTDLVLLSQKLVEGLPAATIPIAFRPQARASIYEWLKSVSGSPFPRIRPLSDPEWGWGLDSDAVAARIRAAGPITISRQDLAQYLLQRFTVVGVDRLCELSPNAIINLDSGGGGCDGL